MHRLVPGHKKRKRSKVGTPPAVSILWYHANWELQAILQFIVQHGSLICAR